MAIRRWRQDSKVATHYLRLLCSAISVEGLLVAREYMVVATRARRGIVVGQDVQSLSGSQFVKCPQLTTSFLFPITLCPSPNATHFLLWAPARGTCGPCVVVRGSRHRCAQAARLVTCSRSPEEPCAWRHRSDCRVHQHFPTTRPAALRRQRRHCLWQRRNASARWHGAREWRGRAHPAPRARAPSQRARMQQTGRVHDGARRAHTRPWTGRIHDGAPHAHSDAARAHTAVDAAAAQQPCPPGSTRSARPVGARAPHSITPPGAHACRGAGYHLRYGVDCRLTDLEWEVGEHRAAATLRPGRCARGVGSARVEACRGLRPGRGGTCADPLFIGPTGREVNRCRVTRLRGWGGA